MNNTIFYLLCFLFIIKLIYDFKYISSSFNKSKYLNLFLLLIIFLSLSSFILSIFIKVDGSNLWKPLLLVAFIFENYFYIINTSKR